MMPQSGSCFAVAIVLSFVTYESCGIGMTSTTILL